MNMKSIISKTIDKFYKKDNVEAYLACCNQKWLISSQLEKYADKMIYI